MGSTYKDKDMGVLFAFNGKWVSWVHTTLGYAAFISALVVGCALHYRKIVENQWYGYPDEWFPSVSATIGDRYPERSAFMILIALTSGPRFALVGLWYLLTARRGHVLPKAVATAGLLRTLTCAGWTYITSTDDHDSHDVLMISYLVLTLPWTAGCIALSPPNAKAIQYRRYLAGAFFGTLLPLIYFFIQHKVHRVAGAYTIYAFFEWALILFDVGFDAVTALDFDRFELVVRDVNGESKGVNTLSVPNAVLEKELLAYGRETTTAAAFASGIGLGPAADIAADVYHGFVLWSTLTGLGVVIWYFPLWHMGISGYEAFVMSTISPVLLAIKPFRTLVVNHQRIAHLISLVGLFAYLVEDPAYRLFTVGFSVSIGCLSWAATFYADSDHSSKLESRILAFMLGLIMSSIAKFTWYTNNPIWPIMHAKNGGWNQIGLILAIPAAFRFTRRTVVQSASIRERRGGSAMLSALGIGGLMFGLHSLLSDTSTMMMWAWDGYPIRGPTSNVDAWHTIAAMSVGLMIGLTKSGIVTSWTAYSTGCAGAAVLTLYQQWRGYYGGLTLAVYLMAISVPMIGNASKKNPALTFGLGFFIYNLLVLFHVWVVAYAFVPGGPLVREHTDWIMFTTMLLIGAGVLGLVPENTAIRTKSIRRRSATAGNRKYHLGALGILNLLFLLASFARFPSNDYQPYHADDRLLTAGIWTIHFSLDNDMWSSERRVRDLIKELEIDVIGLLESDLQRIIMGNRDTTQFLAEDLGMYVDYGPGPNKHTWGAALLSKFPILNSTHHLLPSPVGELAPAIHATLDVYGELVDVFVFHSGQEEDPEDRRLQTEYLSKLMGSSPRPSILLSYLVTRPLQGNYNTYVSDVSGMHDVDPSDWDRWCEYILYKGLRRTGYARVSRSTITDTELQVAKFVVPKAREERERVWGLEREVRDRRVNEDEVPAGWKFPALFRGQGVRGHRYHVFDEPRYYNYD
ncbi:Frag1/DRAM/Sfk1 family-domain-containing protein [Cercophora scortea]|uniref:Frag1/DRAM/Sfk1 family-domain-containing protein n=1 Tax=Cercophora scortea TaxID=314031 RepID=A0AAE0I295_9PEZI|nr:Frag1/DRAM/Sfk1 family-domain-containing protein [Cercophora scortea]